jgi:hypothetical protein
MALKRTVSISALGFAVAQCWHPFHTNPSFSSDQAMEAIIVTPPEVRATLMRACADCHSNETKWPWFSYVAPTSWFVVGHVNKGRRYINLSTWVRPGKEPVDSIDRLNAICKEVRNGDMPLMSYKLIHWESWLSTADVARICEWSKAEQTRLGTLPK